MFKKYKYDVAISVAEQDIAVANKIAASLKAIKISCYLYDKENAEDWGNHLLKISLDKYGAQAKYVLLIVSKNLADKYWASIENQIMQVFRPGKEAYILPLRLDDTPVDGLGKYIVFIQWQQNEAEIAGKLKHKLRIRRQKTVMQNLRILGLLTILLAGIYLLTRFLEAAPDYSKYLSYLAQGDKLVKNNEYEAAKASYRKALKYNTGDPAISRKIALLDSASRYISSQNFTGATKLFEVIISIPPSAGLTTAALSRAGASSSPPFKISIRWVGETLEINITGGVPFSNETQPYVVEGIECTDCIKWSKNSNNYVATVMKQYVNKERLQLKDKVGQFSTNNVPVYTALPPSASDPHPAANKTTGNQEADFLQNVKSGDSLYAAENYKAALEAYTNATIIHPGNATVTERMRVCKEKMDKAAEEAAKNIPRVVVAGGSYTMGTDNGNADDGPAHTVALGSFEMSRTEVTVAQYRKFCSYTGRAMPPEPAYGWAENNPITNVSWEEAVAYCNWVKGRLPTEAEWEYAAQAGSTAQYSGGDLIDRVAVYNNNSGGKPAAVGRKLANSFGLVDMTGNVSEWCSDWYNRKYYAQRESSDPKGAASGTEKVIRGGFYNSVTNSTQDGNQLRISYRNSELPSARRPYIGFRVAWNK